MDTTINKNILDKTSEGKVDWTKRINDDENTEKRPINVEQKKVIDKLEEVLSFLKGVHIMNEEALVNIKKPLDDLQSSLKYLPTGSSFNRLPKELTTYILSYLCDSESFKAAAVCRLWSDIVKNGFTHRHIFQDDDVKIGKHCSNYHECEANSCFMPAEMFRAVRTHKLDIPLTLCHPVTEVDPTVVTEGLLSVSDLTITSDCDCKDDDDDDDDDYKPILSNDQLEHYFEALDKSGGSLDKMELIRVDMTGINQDTLINCLLNRTKWLTLDEGPYCGMLNVETFVNKLSQISTESKLEYLTLHNFEYTCDCESEFCPDLSQDIADALCNVENVKLHRQFPLETETLDRLIENILTKPIAMKSLLIIQRRNFRTLISPEDLITLMRKMKLLALWGFFTPEQLEAARSVPDVEISGTPPCVTIKKGREEIF